MKISGTKDHPINVDKLFYGGFVDLVGDDMARFKKQKAVIRQQHRKGKSSLGRSSSVKEKLSVVGHKVTVTAGLNMKLIVKKGEQIILRTIPPTWYY